MIAKSKINTELEYSEKKKMMQVLKILMLDKLSLS